MKNKLVIFGAGKIGRSFIGQVFSRSGYEVVFIDINQQLLDVLNELKNYKVIIKSNKGDEVIQVSNVRGINLSDPDAVIKELSTASLAALSVGQQGMPPILPLIGEALQLRKLNDENWPLDIIIAENMRNADEYIRSELVKLLPVDFPLNDFVGLVETSIGKMVPIMSNKDLEEDPLQVFAEPYNNLIVAKNGFKNPIPDIEFLVPKENIKAWVDRKLFIHNLGHASAAYLGYQKNPEWTYLYEALADPEILNSTRSAMLQSANILIALYPGEFNISQLESHIEDLLERFQNKALGDTIFRVGCDLRRKLSRNDRLVGPIQAAIKLNLPYNWILNVVKAALDFRATDENNKYFPSDKEFYEKTREVEFVMSDIQGLY